MDSKFVEYKRLLLASIQETDPEKQQDLISKVLEINADISNDIRDQLTKLHAKPSSTQGISDLTQKLLDLQQQYSEIQQSSDKVTTLRMIYSDNKQRLAQAESMYNIYLIGIVVLCIITALLIFRVAFKSGYIMSNPITAALSNPRVTY